MAGDTIVGPTSSDFEVLSCSTKCSACKTAAVAEVQDELARSAVLVAHDGHAIGPVQREKRPLLGRDGIETILSVFYLDCTSMQCSADR